MVTNVNGPLGLQVHKVQFHQLLKMSTLVSRHFRWEKSLAPIVNQPSGLKITKLERSFSGGDHLDSYTSTPLVLGSLPKQEA